ncbi:type II secretion system F family protein [Chungangia koreensis]|uniref:Type II secretion system F family protein n=1 Tax=Chungangia koreensis TaxID=752657 RepID=A0ABV8X462_9LACT
MMNGLLFIFLLLTFSLLFAAILSKLFYQRQVVESRMREYIYQDKPSEDKDQQVKLLIDLSGAKERVRKQLKKKDKNEAIEIKLQQAGVPLKPEEYVMFQWISLAFFTGLFYLFMSFAGLFIGAAIGFTLPRTILNLRKKKRIRQFNDYLPEMISITVNALRAGFSFFQALKNVAEEAQSPVKEELEIVLKEMQYGATVEESLNRLKERMPSEDLDLMIQAIIIQRQVGGNLAVVLEKIVHTIRERLKIQGQIKTLTAQGKLSGMVVAFLPVALAGILSVINPSYMTVLFTTPIGLGMIAFSGLSMLIGFFFIMKITSIEV